MKKRTQTILLSELKAAVELACQRASAEDREEMFRDGEAVFGLVMRYSGPMDPELMDDSGQYRWDVAEQRTQRLFEEEMIKFYWKWSVRLGVDFSEVRSDPSVN